MTDHKPNGADGGVVEFDTATGQIHWLTTNADVTVGQDGSQITAPYHFTVVADDGHTATADLPSETFEVTVSNWQPDITRYPTAPTALQATEDATYTYTDGPSTETGVESNDEGVEGDHWAADRYTYYDLLVNVGGTYITFDDASGYNATNGGRADISFDKTTGEITGWTPNNLDAIAGTLDLEVVHHDGNGGEDAEFFTLTVDNAAPVFSNPDPADPTPTWTLYEDDNPPSPYVPADFPHTYDVQTDDETQDTAGHSVVYTLTVDNNNGASHTLGSTNLISGTLLGFRPNGPEGGLLTFDTDTGVITWATTNADTTRDMAGNLLPNLHDYTFTVTADDGLGDPHTTTETLTVEVINTRTIMDTIADQTYQEDHGAFVIGDTTVNANDEGQESDNVNERDAYYELSVNGINLVPQTAVSEHDPVATDPDQVWYAYTPDPGTPMQRGMWCTAVRPSTSTRTPERSGGWIRAIRLRPCLLPVRPKARTTVMWVTTRSW